MEALLSALVLVLVQLLLLALLPCRRLLFRWL